MIDTQDINLPREEDTTMKNDSSHDERLHISDSETVTGNTEPGSDIVEQEDKPEKSALSDAGEESDGKVLNNPESPKETEKEKPAILDAETLAAMSKPEIVEVLKQIVANPKDYSRNETDALKQTYYKLYQEETEAKKKKFIEEGGEEDAFVMPKDETEAEIKMLISEYRKKRTAIAAEEEKQKEANYILKEHLVERLKALTESQEDFNKRYNEFREIQRKWKEIKLIPQEHAKELWRNYQLYNERFYDIVKINNQFRDYDFKKNLELKTALCETVERLEAEPDTISAFHQLQKHHQQWREIGPVARAHRDLIWERFKASSAVINKKYQAHFENLKEQEEKNFEEKTAICEALEAIDYSTLKTLRDWEKKTAQVIAEQAKWRTIGFATKKHNKKVFVRFRAACDYYFKKKKEFYKSIEQEMLKNLELRKALIEKAESMKDSTEWKETTKEFVHIQKEWKNIGPVSRKHSKKLWKRFIAACDHFFEQKNQGTSSQKSEEKKNLQDKKNLIEQINAIDEKMADEEGLTLLRKQISRWNEIGFVPFKEKDKIYKEFRSAVDKQFDRLKVNERDRRMEQFCSNISELAEGNSKNELYNERNKLMRTYERMKNELQTYENNIGFFNVSSKGGGGLLKEMERKISNLKEEMMVVEKKVATIDENLEE